MSATLLQTTSANTSSATSLALAFGSNVTVGSLLVCYIGSDTTGRTVSASDNVNGAYNLDAQPTGAGHSLGILTFPNSTNGAVTVTASISGAATRFCMAIEEWAGVLAVAPLDQNVGNTGVGVTTVTSGTTGTLAQASELVLTACALSGNGTSSFKVSSPFTASSVSPVSEPTLSNMLGIGNNQTSSTAAQTATFTWTNSLGARACLSTYKLAAVSQPQVFFVRRYVQFNI